ncbi:MAG: H-NS histone family protein [Pseudomonadota bacterium]
MGIELSTLSLVELKKLGANVEKAIATAEARRRKDARAALNKVAKEYGVSIDEVLVEDKPKVKRKKATAAKKPAAAPKYRNPADPKQTWSGKGRRPQWYIAAIESGASQDDLAI